MLTFTVRERHGLCQILKAGPYEVVVFDAFFTKHPRLSDIDGKGLYVSRTPPRNQPFYFAIDEEPPPYYRVLGTRPVSLTSPLPTSFRASPKAEPTALPVAAQWGDLTQLLRAEFRSRGVPPEPYASTHFPGWTAVEAPTLRLIDQLVDAFTKTLEEGTAATRLAALEATVGAFNRLEVDLDAPAGEVLAAKLCALAMAAGVNQKRAAAVIEDVRKW